MSIITLTTDFGYDDWYVGAMKGVILSINLKVTLVDITHNCPSGDIMSGAFIIKNSDYFPQNTIHIIVVDPGVGSSRIPLIAKLSNNQIYVLPDNGLLTLLLQKHSLVEAFAIENHKFMLNSISNTFHGRDIFAPAAAYASTGINISEFGRPINDLVQLSIQPIEKIENSISGTIVYIDKFGNLISNIHNSFINKKILLARLKNYTINQVGYKFCDVGRNESVVIFSSDGYIEIAVNLGSAKNIYNVEVGEKMIIEFDN
ncbi:hypothetical protein SteCoe_12095 [Stentor coeruleus]|uniref:SAM-dependent chlorinase/fluorinase n=1 Tax=Stentor coeruleus TaxID=5963 RepID=A0A1R2CBJ5_9CILI|nr:hypothetical protein SteCoe_12095 [Stentor coeruleus]